MSNGSPPLQQCEYPATGNPEADRVLGRLNSSDPEFDDCADAASLIQKQAASIELLHVAICQAVPLLNAAVNPFRVVKANDILRHALVAYADSELANPEAAPVAPTQPESLHTFLNAAAAEGYVLNGVDAADLYVELFPERYVAALEGLHSGMHEASTEAAPVAPTQPVGEGEQSLRNAFAIWAETQGTGEVSLLDVLSPIEIEAAFDDWKLTLVAASPHPAPMPYPTDAQIDAVYEQTMGQHLRSQDAPAVRRFGRAMFLCAWNAAAPKADHIPEAGKMLGDLLARIHGDGGHYASEHGIEKAVADADRILAEWRAYKPAPLQQGEYLPLPIGEGTVYCNPDGSLMIDASLAFFDGAKIGDKLYTADQVCAAIDADRAAREALAAPPAQEARLNPDMPVQELRLHMGELTTDEVLVARAAIRWANSQKGARVPLSDGQIDVIRFTWANPPQAPTDAEILDAAEDFRSQYTHGGTTFDAFDEIGFARAVLAKWGTPAPVAEDAANWHWLASYLVGPRTDLDDEIVASESVNDLRKLVSAARAKAAQPEGGA